MRPGSANATEHSGTHPRIDAGVGDCADATAGGVEAELEAAVDPPVQPADISISATIALSTWILRSSTTLFTSIPWS
jgi:hypothetical protein